MALTASNVVSKFGDFLTAPTTGLSTVVASLTASSGLGTTSATETPAIKLASIVQQNVPIALMEKALATKYPAVHIYTDRVQNLLTEKFRTFSGKVRTVAEVRVSQDRIEGLEDQVRTYVDAVTQILDGNRGDWGQGMFFTGGYEVKFDPVQHGGRNFIQVAKVIFEVDMSS